MYAVFSWRKEDGGLHPVWDRLNRQKGASKRVPLPTRRGDGHFFEDEASVELVAPDVPLRTGSIAGGNWLNPPCLPDCYLSQTVGGIVILLHTLMNQTCKIKEAQEMYITKRKYISMGSAWSPLIKWSSTKSWIFILIFQKHFRAII